MMVGCTHVPSQTQSLKDYLNRLHNVMISVYGNQSNNLSSFFENNLRKLKATQCSQNQNIAVFFVNKFCKYNL